MIKDEVYIEARVFRVGAYKTRLSGFGRAMPMLLTIGDGVSVALSSLRSEANNNKQFSRVVRHLTSPETLDKARRETPAI